jgi:hypothetical protein
MRTKKDSNQKRVHHGSSSIIHGYNYPTVIYEPNKIAAISCLLSAENRTLGINIDD